MSDDAQAMLEVITAIEGWHQDRNGVHGTTYEDQYEVLSIGLDTIRYNAAQGEPLQCAIGIMVSSLVNLALKEGLYFEDCLESALQELRDYEDATYVADMQLELEV